MSLSNEKKLELEIKVNRVLLMDEIVFHSQRYR